MDGDAIRQWLATLDSISYYELFRVPPNASPDALRAAFHEFAQSFHPDGHNWRHPTEQIAITYIFKRGTEAYRVLADPQLRLRYDEALASGILRPEQLILDQDTPRYSVSAPGAPGRVIDKVRTAGARPFVRRAEELHKGGDPQQAKLQLVMAMHMDPHNPDLEAYAKVLDEAVRAKRK